MAGNLLPLLLLAFPKPHSSSMGQLLADHEEKARKEIRMHEIVCNMQCFTTALKPASPASVSLSQYKASHKKRLCVHKELVQ